MAEHLHGYPRCETPAGTPCPGSDLHYEECKNHGALRSCEASVVDGIPTGQYRCTHDEAPARPAPARAPSKPRKAAKAKPKAARKAARKAAPKKKGKAKKAGKRGKTAAKKRSAARRPAKKGARKKKK